MTVGFAVKWTPAEGRARKIVFDPQPAKNRWRRTEFELHESQWRQVGTERVDTVSLTSETAHARDTHSERGVSDE
ncbi:hypothetical protein CV102_18245 [Natronococcus pandeyae]|uniref:Uncharacterized protein n=1 Tax=Natronococcus pandeyae TaxID=2055836 RepID=A0A8J8Q1P4_9EURY|nr:hypothetical protein [Natronococcus pandeyae]TYL37249.1 hypothetical protein CV102_18245 [Natronococcus pandeyae]